jgi:hypothetical protein
VYERPNRPPRRHHDDPDPDSEEFRAALVDAIEHDPAVRAAIGRLLAALRTRRPAPPQRTERRRDRS